jgi:hypothetical protein
MPQRDGNGKKVQSCAETLQSACQASGTEFRGDASCDEVARATSRQFRATPDRRCRSEIQPKTACSVKITNRNYRDGYRPRMGTKDSKGRSSALARAEHGGAPLALTANEKVLLADAIREGATLADKLQTQVVEYGRWLLAKVFGDDTKAALDRKSKNPVWLELLRRAGGPTLRLNRRLVYVALRMAAWDKRIQDSTFRSLDAPRKELLLPLDDETKLKKAANHVAKLGLTQTDTRQYVTELMAEDGKPRQVRFTGAQLGRKMKLMREDLEGAATLRRVKALRAEMDVKDRDGLVAEMESLRDVVSELVRALKGK